MDLSRLKQIHEQQAQETKELRQRNEDAVALISLQETVVKSFSALVDYLDSKVSKTVVVNQLKEIDTPDALKVVEAVNSLHSTLKTHENTDLTEITQVMRAILDESKAIPKDKVEISIPEQKDYVAQFESLTNAIKAVEKVVKEQKLVAEAPVVNVEPSVNVEPPDLKPLQTAIKEVVNSVNGIVIPEYKTDNAKVEELLKKSNKLLKDLLEKPTGGGGGGGVSAWVTVNQDGTPVPIQLDASGAVPVVSSGSTTYITVLRVDSGDDLITYVGKAVPGTATSDAAWQIASLDENTNLDLLYADGGAFTQIYDNREGLTYA